MEANRNQRPRACQGVTQVAPQPTPGYRKAGVEIGHTGDIHSYEIHIEMLI